MTPLAAKATAELEELLADFEAVRKRARQGDLSDLPGEAERLVALMRAGVERWTSPGSTYRKTLDQMTDLNHGLPHQLIRRVPGVVTALRDDFKAGRLDGLESTVRGEVFSDFLDMAGHLLAEGYKDAAAVIAGATLEEHIRSLCGKYAIATSKPDGTPRKLDTMNADLAKAGVYSGTDQKLVTAHAGLRNDAAHGNFSAYAESQVRTMVVSIRDFVARNPV